MAYKFKVGDKVKVVDSVEIGFGDHHGIRKGRTAKVIHVDTIGNTGGYPYELKFFKGRKPKFTWFNVRELELVERPE